MANLFPEPFAADLPEDWTQGQTVSPNGIEVGLEEQYGYNYLMKLVNSLADGLNGVNSNVLLNSLGTIPVSNGGTGATTAAAARNALGLGNTTGALPIANGGTGATTASAALTNLGAQAKLGFTPVQQGGGIGQKANKIYIGWTGTKLNVQVDSSNQGAVVFENTLNSLMQSALQSGGVSMVKSIQRGVISILGGQSENTATISAVNTNKSVVLFGGYKTTGNSGIFCTQLTLTNSTTVTAARNAVAKDYINIVPYQVIEYY